MARGSWADFCEAIGKLLRSLPPERMRETWEKLRCEIEDPTTGSDALSHSEEWGKLKKDMSDAIFDSGEVSFFDFMRSLHAKRDGKK